MVDIIVGNENRSYQLLINTVNGSFDDEGVIDLPGGALETFSIAVADVNNDGMSDIIIENEGQANHLLIHRGDGRFDAPVDLTGGVFDTFSIAVSDVNNDGMVDIHTGNRNKNDQLLMNSGDDNFGNPNRSAKFSIKVYSHS